MIYPQRLNSKKGEAVFRILLITSIALGIILVLINKLTTPKIHWAAIANAGIIYVWLTVIYSIKKGTNIAGHVLVQTIATSAIVIYIDDRIGFIGWSINMAIPIILITANVTMLVLTIVTHKNYIKYVIYQLIIVLITITSIWLILEQNMKLRILSNVAFIVSTTNLLISLILCFKDVKEVIKRKLHM